MAWLSVPVPVAVLVAAVVIGGRLPPCLEELVDMQQTDAGGRLVLPREHQQHERRKSIGNCIL